MNVDLKMGSLKTEYRISIPIWRYMKHHWSVP